jgi:hypothetical protein
MVDVPQQDWSYYEAVTNREERAWLRGLSPQDRFAIYEDMFNVIWTAPRTPIEIERLERLRWEQKLSVRLRLVEAFTKLDQFRRERAAANNSR